MATITLAVRGNSTNARYAGDSSYGTKMNSAYITTVADAGYLSGSYIDLTDTTKVKALIFNGMYNTPNSRSHSILLRFAPNYSGAPAARRMLWSFSVGLGASSAYLELFHEVTSGHLLLIGKNEAGSVTAATINLGAWTTNVSGTIYDFLFVWDGTTTANAMKLYIDNVLLGSGGTASNALIASWDNKSWKAVSLGCGTNGTVCAMKVDEFVVWDGAVNPASVALVSGTGSLNGSSRTSLVDCSLFEGSSYSDPGLANVKTGTTYIFAGSTITGTYTGSDRWSDPGLANVKTGTTYLVNSVTTTGTYVASERYSDPGIANVRLGTEYIFADSTLTGTLIVPGTLVNSTATASLNDIKENIRSMLYAANTTTGSPIDLSYGLSNSKRVKQVLKTHPEMIRPQASFFPLVTCYISEKDIVRMDIAKTQLAAKRRAKVKVKVIGSIWNSNMTSISEDPADEDINQLMENIELILRGDHTLGNIVNWQLATNCRYFTSILDEQTHLRSGVLDVDCEVFY